MTIRSNFRIFRQFNCWTFIVNSPDVFYFRSGWFQLANQRFFGSLRLCLHLKFTFRRHFHPSVLHELSKRLFTCMVAVIINNLTCGFTFFNRDKNHDLICGQTQRLFVSANLCKWRCFLMFLSSIYKLHKFYNHTWNHNLIKCTAFVDRWKLNEACLVKTMTGSNKAL